MFSVLGALDGEEGVEAGDVAGGAGGGDAGVKRAEEGGHGTTAGAAEGSNAGGVDLRAGLEVVDGRHAVPEHVLGEGFAEEDGLEAGFAVLAGGLFGEGLPRD